MTRDQVSSDQAWERIAPLSPTQYGKGRPFRDHRQAIEGMEDDATALRAAFARPVAGADEPRYDRWPLRWAWTEVPVDRVGRCLAVRW